MSRYNELLEKIRNKTAVVTVIGLGYIGLPTALFYAKSGLTLYGIDVNKKLVRELSNGKISMLEDGLAEIAAEHLSKIDLHTDYEELENSDICVLCLPSPIDKDYRPDTKALEYSIEDLAKVLKKGPLVLVESTVAVGTTERLAELFAEKTGLEPGKDFWFAHCPERVLPGQIVKEMDTNHRLAGGITPESTELTVEFLKTVFNPELINPTNSKVSETAKLAENAFRDTNIAYANELAKLCTTFSIDVSEVIRLANLHPRVDILNPGLGVGGYCLPKDGWILVQSARDLAGDADLIPTARAVNDSMPKHTLQRILSAIIDSDLSSPRVALLGLSFKPNVSDMRNSPTVALLHLLKMANVDTVVYDPLVETDVESERALSIDEVAKSCDILVLCVNHKIIMDELTGMDLSEKVFVDPGNNMRKLRNKTRHYVGLSS